MITEVILVFDTEDHDQGESAATLEEIVEYANELNLATAARFQGYQGWRVEDAEDEIKEGTIL